MQIEVRGDRVVIDGYVNAVGRDSRPIRCQTGDFVEQVEPGVFGKALKRAKNIKLLLNHRTDRELGSTADGNLTLTEDSIGLRAHAEIGDEEVIRKARNHQLSGWSFGMYVNESEMEQRSNAIPRRKLKDIDMFEVSVIDTTMLPCYAGTSVECRAEGENAALLETRAYDDAVEVTENLPENYFDDAERQLAQLRADSNWLDEEKKSWELRYNPYHDPTNGRFTTSSGGGGGYLFVGKGEKGKGSYVFDASGKDSSSKLRNMSDEQREDFMAAYNLSGNEFKENHTPNQAYNAAIEHYQSISKNFTDKIPRSENSMAVKGMEFLQQKISEEKYLQRKKRHEELRQEYLKLLPKNADGKFERQITNLMSVSNEALERKIQMLKSGQNRAEPVNSVFNAEKYLAQLRAEKVSAADQAIRDATGGVVLSDTKTTVTATATKKNKKASTQYDKEVLSAEVDANGDVLLDYAKGWYSGYYGDPIQEVDYTIKSGFVDGTPINMDLSKAKSISGRGTYSAREAAKEAGMTWNGGVNAWLSKDHLLNVNTKVSREELNKMSDKEVDKIYRSLVMKSLISDRGYTISKASEKMKSLMAKPKEAQIDTIEKYNNR